MVTQLMDNENGVKMCFLHFSKAFDAANLRILCVNLAVPANYSLRTEVSCESLILNPH